MAGQWEPIGSKVASHDTDPLGAGSAIQQGTDTSSHFAGLGPGPGSLEALDPRGSYVGQRRRRRLFDLGDRREPRGEALGERALDSLSLPRGRTVEDEHRLPSPQQRLEEIGGHAGRVRESMDEDGPGREHPIGIRLQKVGGTAQKRPESAQLAAPHLLFGAGRHPHQGAGALHRGTAGDIGTVQAQGFESRVGMDGLQPRVQKIAGRGRDSAVAIHEISETRPEGRLLRGMALREDLGEGKPPGCRLTGPLQDFKSEAVESLNDDAGSRPVPRNHRGSMSPQAARRHHDTNGEREEGRIPAGRIEKPGQAIQDGSFGGKSAARDKDLPRRRRRSRRALRLEKAELDCHGARISRKTRHSRNQSGFPWEPTLRLLG
jgi:hypothetical protein